MTDLSIEHIWANEHSIYVIMTGSAKHLVRFAQAGEGSEHALEEKRNVKLTNFGKAITGDNDTIWVLMNTGDICVYSADDLSLKHTHKCAFKDPVQMVYSHLTKELFVGDKKGAVHFLKSDDFSETGSIAKHTQGINCMNVSKDGSKIASGDAYRYANVMDA